VETLIRDFRPGDEAAAYYVCLKTGDRGADGEPFYREDPDALGRIYVGPYLRFEPDLALMLEDDRGVCGYALGAFDTRTFFDRYERLWRPALCAQFPEPGGDRSTWTRVEAVHHAYHRPEYDAPEPYDRYPSHLHIDLLPRKHRQGHGQRMIRLLLERLRGKGSPGVHLCMSADNEPAYRFYRALGFQELSRQGPDDDRTIFMGMPLAAGS
jgi:GNAT superfamily N-acetyltransferase